MKERINFNFSRLTFYIIFAVFFIIKGCCLLIIGDDVWWGGLPSYSFMLKNNNPNGRYFTNFITLYSAHYTLFRVIAYSLTFIAFVIVLSFILGKYYKFKWIDVFFVVPLFFITDGDLYRQIFNWISGYTNYVISLVFFFIFYLFSMPVFNKKMPKGGIVKTLLFLIIGFLGALCIEHITIYNIIFSVFIVILSLVYLKKVSFVNISYLIGSVAGAVLMFMNSNYSDISNNADKIGERYFEFSISDIWTKIYLEIIPHYSATYFILHLLIVCSILYMYYKKFVNSEKKPKYAKYCIPVLIGYFVYSFFTAQFEALAIMDGAFKSRAIETAFVFIYIISLIYMLYILLDGAKLMNSIVLLISTLFVTGPFIFINPINSRCFFADFIFWYLFTFALVIEAVHVSRVSENSILKNLAISFSSVLIIWLSYIDISNKYVDVLRLNYVKEQYESGQRYINFIKLPYPEYTADTALGINDEDPEIYYANGKYYPYFPALYIYNGIAPEVFDRVTITIDMYDYNLSKENS
ncbi:DUF6056 family protein [Ruminococcus flavefaciens]|uniref:DUF6056 family protein n=1 Tax=Ruminococcus flavefaciens TaxID=1265 RepID=UPI0026EBA4CB|nr:DUF6056 family protein [Ruminococcus flavefaciens]MDD7515277.1 DUF6056 family protein [Ruminococcus flavefaciens]MDY5690299.1 DUF6056 family protein [Ruminococcus flavefaciens]